MREQAISCRLELSKCVGKAQKRAFRESESRYFDAIQETIANAFQGFDYQRSCQGRNILPIEEEKEDA